MSFQDTRDKLLTPISSFATRYRITPIMISIGGVVAMIICAILITLHIPIAAIIFLAISIFADFLDGSLARYQHAESNKGRTIDIVADTLSFVIFAIGLAKADMLSMSVAWAVILLYAASVWMSTKRAIKSTQVSGLQMYQLHRFWIIPGSAKALMYASFIVSIFISNDIVALMRLLAVILLAFSVLRSTFRKA